LKTALKSALIRGVQLVAKLSPRSGIRAAGVAARLTRPLDRGVPRERLAAIHPDLTPDALRDARAQIWSSFLRGEALEAILASGRSPGLQVARNETLAGLRRPIILASVHTGPLHALGPALGRLGADVVVLEHGVRRSRPDATLLPVGDDEWQRARTFHRALITLRAGGVVFMAIDGFHGSVIEVPMLGGTMPVARGAFALARITNTPILPLVARWRGISVEVTCGDPIAPSSEEEAMAGAMAGWLERYLRESPGEISLRTLELLRAPTEAAAPRAAAPAYARGEPSRLS
jgi:lauroyl/myristoyl acyltransferase